MMRLEKEKEDLLLQIKELKREKVYVYIHKKYVPKLRLI